MPKRFETLMYSAGGVVALLVILVLANYLLGAVRGRVDLTDGKLYTLSDGTYAVLKKLDAPVRIRFYFSQDATQPLPLKTFGRRVEDMLAEFKRAANGKVIVEKVDPQPDSDAEDSAQLDGVDAQTLPNGERIFLGLAVSIADRRIAIPALTLDREQLLEYDIARAIARTANPDRPTVGVMSGLPLFGSPGAAQMGVPPSEKQVIISELERDFKLKRVSLSASEIDPGIKTLLVVHPRELSATAQYALDQYVMRGGKLIVMVDPFAYFDPSAARQPGREEGTSSNMDRLFKAWGITYDPGKVLQDTQYMSGGGQQGAPTVLNLMNAAFSPDDIATQRLGNVLLAFSGAFGGTPAAGLKQTVLLKSSKLSRLVPSAEGTKTGEEALKDFKASGVEQPLAIRLTGKFKTAFPDGAPVDEKKPATPAAASATAASVPAAAPLKESAENSVVLIADTDFINDQAAVQIQNIFGQRIVVPANGNLAFVQALVEQLAGDQNLIALRSRAVAVRPFTVIRDMEARVQQTYLGKINALQATVQETTRKLQAMQQERAPGQASTTALSPAQQAEIDAFRRTAAQARRELKQVRSELRTDSQALEFWTKVGNIAIVPVLVTLAGLLLALRRRQRVVHI